MLKKGNYFSLIRYLYNGEPRERRVANLTQQELYEEIVLPYNSRRSVLQSDRTINFASICEIHIFMANGKFRNGVMRAVAELDDAKLRQMIDEEDGEHFQDITSNMLEASQNITPAHSHLTSQSISESPQKSEHTEKFSASRVFIVHGRDEAMKESVARVIEKLNLEAIILHEQAELGRTIIEKFTQCSDVGYALVLLSPDDFAYPRNSTPEKGKYRARQNVILELGYFIGKLGRERVMALNKGDENFEIPTDFAGVVYTQFDANEKWKFKLVKELKAHGYKVSADQLL